MASYGFAVLLLVARCWGAEWPFPLPSLHFGKLCLEQI
jgi:hypothetical protein